MPDLELVARRVALALDALVPSEFRVGAKGTWVTITSSKARAAYDVQLDDHDVAVGLYAVLSNVQDFVSEHTALPWPPTREWAEPKVAIDGPVALCGYGRADTFVVRFEVGLG